MLHRYFINIVVGIYQSSRGIRYSLLGILITVESRFAPSITQIEERKVEEGRVLSGSLRCMVAIYVVTTLITRKIGSMIDVAISSARGRKRDLNVIKRRYKVRSFSTTEYKLSSPAVGGIACSFNKIFTRGSRA